MNLWFKILKIYDIVAANLSLRRVISFLTNNGKCTKKPNWENRQKLQIKKNFEINKLKVAEMSSPITY